MTQVLAIGYPGQRGGGWLGIFTITGLLSAYGISLILRGLRSDTTDGKGHPVASPSWFILGGILAQIPLVGSVWLYAQ